MSHWSSPNGCHPDCPECKREQEPTDQELLEFLLSKVRSQNLKMDGLSDWYFPSNLLFKHRCKSAREAVVAAYLRHKEQRYGRHSSEAERGL